MKRAKRILVSLFVVVGVVSAAAVGTRAYFSDTETSEGNVLAAGAIDLLIDNHSWYYGPDGLVERQDLSWKLDNLDNHLFFNYGDMKPGDWGEDTVSVHVNDNDAWLCADLWVTRDDDMSSAEPELDAGDAQEDPTDPMDGELSEELFFVFWVDDGDNVWECDYGMEGMDINACATGEDSERCGSCERVLTYGTANAAEGGLHYALADTSDNAVSREPLTGGETYYIGKYWCYGDVMPLPLSQDGLNTQGPDVRQGSGFVCSGAEVGNMSQTDEVTADVSFYAVQSRHNEEFVCAEGGYYKPNAQRLRLENKTKEYVPIMDDGVYGILDFKSPNPTFEYDLSVYGLQPNTEYILHYYADPWPSSDGMQIGAPFMTDGDGNAVTSGDVDLGVDLPVPADDNYPTGAKLWVIPSSHWDGSIPEMVGWDQELYLWEWNLIKYDDSNN